MSNQFRIPRQKDQSLIEALTAIRNEMQELVKLVIGVTPHVNGTHIRIPDPEPVKAVAIAYVLAENSEVMPTLQLIELNSGSAAMQINRPANAIVDDVTINWDQWINHVPVEQKSKIFVKLNALARKHLHPLDSEASLIASGDTAWSRYRDSQQAVLSSLQETQKSVLFEFTRHGLEAEATAKAKLEKLETDLKSKYSALSTELGAEHKKKLDEIDKRDAALKKLEETFNTKEARYVARQEQKNQIDQIKGWLEGWSLTKGTTTKRLTVAIAYAVAIVATAGFAIWFSAQNVEILKSKDLTQIAWWQWVLLSLKSILPFAAFTTFIIYFIRWSSAWARQHAEEEFRNRARVLDIGRTSWLLEAVRDAQDNNKELPPDLVKELARNLFSYASPNDSSDLHPQAFSDILMQGLSSIRVKAADGTEVEASRVKKKSEH
jgi:hypothetical protein